MDVLLPVAPTTWTSLAPFMSSLPLCSPALNVARRASKGQRPDSSGGKGEVTGPLFWCDVKGSHGLRFSPGPNRMSPHHRASITPARLPAPSLLLLSQCFQGMPAFSVHISALGLSPHETEFHEGKSTSYSFLNLSPAQP